VEEIGKDELEASICRDSFYHFVLRFWDIVVAEKLVDNWHIKFLCDELQTVAERVFLDLPKLYDLVINISPGSTKSTICSVLFEAWVWTRMPTARCICSSYAYTLAMDLSRKTRDVVQSDKYIRLFPDIVIIDDQNTKQYFVNKHGGYRYATGTGGSVTGMHGHFLLTDDPLDPAAAISKPLLKAANDFQFGTLQTRKVDKAVAVSVLIMQRLHQEDPTGVALKKEREPGGAKIRHICLPAEIDRTNRKMVKPRRCRSYYKDGLMDPIRLSRKILRESKATLGEYSFAGQFGQWPVPLEGGMFKVERITLDTPPRAWRQRVRYWDKAGTEDDGAYSVGLLMGEDMNGFFWILDVVRGQWESYARERMIKQTAQADGVTVLIGIEQEPGSGGKESAQNTVKMLAGFRVRVDRPTGDKVLRADPVSVQVNSGDVKMAKGEWNRPFTEEVQFFPKGKFKDQIDSLSGAFTLMTRNRTRAGAIQ